MGSRISLDHEHGARHTGWFTRPKPAVPSADQEAEVRERLYARPDPNERTVERVGPARRMADRPAA
ncbi:MAG TPA: hypothetical protein VN740_07425 [Solirubrobacteraceae bacterium]|nr:hypothetical protein [Solirubrobacteraceae bacterium]